jgi:hypothetical protein
MNYEIYCDESCIEALFDKNAHKYSVIGGIWIPKEFRKEMRARLNAIKQKHSIMGEMKWKKVSPAYIGLYKDVVEFFFSSPNIRYRAIIIDAALVDNDRFNNGCGELGFYKFYYQLLYHWLFPDNEYNIFLDYKVNGYRNRIIELKRILCYSSKVLSVQALPSNESVAIQLADILTGAIASKFNKEITSPAKLEIIKCIEQYKPILKTSKNENKFNIFDINLRKGW